MGYQEVLDVFEKQLDDVIKQQQDLKEEHLKDIALDTKSIAEELDRNIKSVYLVIKRLLAEEKIKKYEFERQRVRYCMNPDKIKK